MAFQLRTATRTAMIQALADAVGSSGTLKIFSGAEPANCAAADPSGLLATMTLPASPFSVSNGAMTKSGTWSTTGSASGTAASYRFYDGSSNCIMQGTCYMTGGSGDLELDNTSIASGQTVTGNSYTVTAGGA